MKQQVITEKQKANKLCLLLTQEENDQVFRLLGRKCLSMCTAVAQVYKTEASAHSHWRKKHTGILCLIKDGSKRSYFIRLYCLIKNELAWEHEFYDAISINRVRPYLLTFEGQDGHVALNFASEEECETFHRISNITIENRNRKKHERKVRPKSQTAPAIPSTYISEKDDATTVTLRNHPKISNIQIMPNINTFQTKKTQSTSKDKKRGRYRKEDISTPMNFVHVSHVGWDAQKGFDLTGNEEDEMLKFFFSRAGVSEQHLNDRDTREFIYEFVQSNNVLASVKSERVEKSSVQVPPPVPSRQQHQNGTQRTAPPPPPVRQPPPPPPPPSRPSPASAVSLPAQAPPPPPPLPSPPLTQQSVPVSHALPNSSEEESKQSLPIINDSRSALLESIRKGTTLKKVDLSSLSTGSGDSRSELMSEIRQGVELRPASSRDLPCASNRVSDSGSGTDALADALRRALQLRGKVIHSSDEDSEESSENDGEWED